MGAEFSSQMNRGIYDLYTGTPRDVLRRYELVVKDIKKFQYDRFWRQGYERWYRYVLLRNMLKRQIEKLYMNKQLEDMGIDFDVGMLAGINVGEYNNTFPRHVIDYDGKIQWLPGEFPEMITVYIKENNPTVDEAGILREKEVTISHRISRFAQAKELWNMVKNSKNERYLPTEYIVDTVRNTFKIRAPNWTIYYHSEDPLTLYSVNDDSTLYVYW